ncbi:hypothetical protein [Agarivorans sp. Alg241-V36]|uniref:hypothetical protein n=1 Tax=Agarivorans sp. Alg241-V36 TaxID=2305992 RepID=UPI0013D395D6|nr:hypothetical protein [Agarivorans sp. Alg241-V36]
MWQALTDLEFTLHSGLIAFFLVLHWRLLNRMDKRVYKLELQQDLTKGTIEKVSHYSGLRFAVWW